MAVYFTDNVRDLSNYEGYQFEFYCERCGNGYRSPYQADKLERGKDIIRGLGSMFGGKMGQVGTAVGWLDRSTNSKQKDKALKDAVESIRHHFTQCRGCSDWVCADVCWNDAIGQCFRCSPDVAQELSRAQAEAQVQQLREQAREVNWTKDLPMADRNPVVCPSCQAHVSPGKFCASCGSALATEVPCRACQAPKPTTARFCPQCGTDGW